MDQLEMDTLRRERADAWLRGLEDWAGSRRRAALACEVVRCIVDVDDPEYAAGVRWAGGAPTVEDFTTALELYGPVFPDPYARTIRARKVTTAAANGDAHAVRVLVR